MPYQSFNGGVIPWPLRSGGWTSTGATTLNADGEALAMIGHIRWADGGSHTIDTSGSSKIYVHTSTSSTFDDATSVMHIGIKDVDTTTGFPARPDGSYDVNSVVTTAADTSPALTTTSSFVAATPTTGTKTMTHGDLIAVVVTLVTTGTTPAASVLFMNPTGSEDSGSGSPARPFTSGFTTGVWAYAAGGGCVLLVASDGTYGTLDGVGAIGQFTTATFSDSSNPDEYGNIFQVPFACKVSGFTFAGAVLGATGDFQYDLTSTPLGTPASLISGPIAVTAESMGGSTTASYRIMFPTEISLSANTDYCISVKATGAGNVSMFGLTLPAAGARVLLPGGTTTNGATRNGGTGAFTASTTIIRSISVLLAGYEYSSGGGTYFSVGG